jgi:hypothetical protein
MSNYQLVDRNRAHVTRQGDYEELSTSTRDSMLADLQNEPLMNAAHNERDYAIFLSYWSFLMILQAFGMPSSELGAKPARPDVPAHAS